MTTVRRYRASRSLSPPKARNGEQEQLICSRCEPKIVGTCCKKDVSNLKDKAQQTKISHENQLHRMKEEHHQYRAPSSTRRPNTRLPCLPVEPTQRGVRQQVNVCTKHEKEKVKMQATIEKLQEAYCDKESKLQDSKTQLIRERRMSEIMERQLKNARNLSEQLNRIIHEREQEIRSLKNILNKRQDSKNVLDTAIQAALLKAATAARQSDKKKILSTREEFQATVRKVNMLQTASGYEHSECSSLSSTSVDKVLKEVNALIEGLRIKDEAIKGLQEECTRRLDKIQTLQRSIHILQDQLMQTSQHHSSVCTEKDNMISQLQHTLRETEATVENLLSEKTKVALEGEHTIQELQEVIQQKDLVIKRMQVQLEEAHESKESELLQLKETIQIQQQDLQANKNVMETINEELFNSQKQSENLQEQLNQEKCTLSRFMEEINSLTDKLAEAADEMQKAKKEYQEKDEELKNTQKKIKEMYMSFFGDHCISEKIQSLCVNKREFTGRKVLSEEDIFGKVSESGVKCHHKAEKGERVNTSILSNSQIHKQQLSELQQQVNESQAVCGILQEQLREVTDFLDQLLHIEIPPSKDFSALSLIRQFGKHLPAAKNILSIPKGRVTPEGISSNSQLDVECHIENNQVIRDTRDQYNDELEPHSEGSKRILNHHGKFLKTDIYHRSSTPTQDHITLRSLSAEDVQQSHVNWISVDPKLRKEFLSNSENLVMLEASDSDEILFLLNDSDMTEDVNHHQHIQKSEHSFFLHQSENQDSKEKCHTDDLNHEGSTAVMQNSASFGSFSDSMLLSYEQSENICADGKNESYAHSEELHNAVQIADAGLSVNFMSSDSDIWSEPDKNLSRKRAGLCLNEEPLSSGNLLSYFLEDNRRRNSFVQNSSEGTKHRTMLQLPVKNCAHKVKRWLHRLKTYLHIFEETSYNLSDEMDNFSHLKTQILEFLSSLSSEKDDICNDIIFDIKEYTRSIYFLQKKLEKAIHYNRQLIEALVKKPSGCKNNERSRKKVLKKDVRPHRKKPKVKKTVVSCNVKEKSETLGSNVSNQPWENSDIQVQLVGYHSTLISCQDMIKELHSQLKERHCSEMINKHELNKTVYGYLEDIDNCIEELCKKMENSTAENSQTFGFKHHFNNKYILNEVREQDTYSNVGVVSTSLLDKLKENEDRLFRFEVLLNDREQQLKMSAENALQLEVQLNSIKQSLYEIQIENLELKECLEFSENKQLEMEDSSNQMLRELQLTMQRLGDLEERFRRLGEEQQLSHKDSSLEMENCVYPEEYSFNNESSWGQDDIADCFHVAPPIVRDENDSRGWNSENY